MMYRKMILLALFLAIFISSLKLSTTTHNYDLEISSNIYFTTDFHSYFHFPTTIYCDEIIAESDRIIFYNLSVYGVFRSYWVFNVSNGNATIIQFYKNNYFKVQVDGTKGQYSIITVYSSYRPTKIMANNYMVEETNSLANLKKSKKDTWFYDSSSKLLYVRVQHHSPITITIDYESQWNRTREKFIETWGTVLNYLAILALLVIAGTILTTLFMMEKGGIDVADISKRGVEIIIFIVIIVLAFLILSNLP